MSRRRMINQARSMGIKDPDRYDNAELQAAIGQRLELLEAASFLDIEAAVGLSDDALIRTISTAREEMIAFLDFMGMFEGAPQPPETLSTELLVDMADERLIACAMWFHTMGFDTTEMTPDDLCALIERLDAQVPRPGENPNQDAAVVLALQANRAGDSGR